MKRQGEKVFKRQRGQERVQSRVRYLGTPLLAFNQTRCQHCRNTYCFLACLWHLHLVVCGWRRSCRRPLHQLRAPCCNLPPLRRLEGIVRAASLFTYSPHTLRGLTFNFQPLDGRERMDTQRMHATGPNSGQNPQSYGTIRALLPL